MAPVLLHVVSTETQYSEEQGIIFEAKWKCCKILNFWKKNEKS